MCFGGIHRTEAGSCMGEMGLLRRYPQNRSRELTALQQLGLELSYWGS
jgi:hypothetical protein